MKTTDIHDDLFRQAVDAIDAGEAMELNDLIDHDPGLVQKRLQTPQEEGYFKDPYLSWFVADNPIRNFRLAPNIVEVIERLAEKVKLLAPETSQQQLDYALELVVTGRTARESGLQIAMMDALINAGAKPGGAKSALANGNIDAAEHLIKRGGKLTLSIAVGLRKDDDIEALLTEADQNEQLTALALAAFLGMADIVAHLIEAGITPDGYPPAGNGFHHHATPLHQAVSSGSLATVRILVEAGADITAPDKTYHGTPLQWAGYLQDAEETTDEMREKYSAIENYLKSASKL